MSDKFNNFLDILKENTFKQKGEHRLFEIPFIKKNASSYSSHLWNPYAIIKDGKWVYHFQENLKHQEYNLKHWEVFIDLGDYRLSLFKTNNRKKAIKRFKDELKKGKKVRESYGSEFLEEIGFNKVFSKTITLESGEKEKGKWYRNKEEGGRMIFYFGEFDSKEDIKKIRDYCKKYINFDLLWFWRKKRLYIYRKYGDKKEFIFNLKVRRNELEKRARLRKYRDDRYVLFRDLEKEKNRREFTMRVIKYGLLKKALSYKFAKMNLISKYLKYHIKFLREVEKNERIYFKNGYDFELKDWNEKGYLEIWDNEKRVRFGVLLNPIIFIKGWKGISFSFYIKIYKQEAEGNIVSEKEWIDLVIEVGDYDLNIKKELSFYRKKKDKTSHIKDCYDFLLKIVNLLGRIKEYNQKEQEIVLMKERITIPEFEERFNLLIQEERERQKKGLIYEPIKKVKEPFILDLEFDEIKSKKRKELLKLVLGKKEYEKLFWDILYEKEGEQKKANKRKRIYTKGKKGEILKYEKKSGIKYLKKITEYLESIKEFLWDLKNIRELNYKEEKEYVYFSKSQIANFWNEIKSNERKELLEDFLKTYKRIPKELKNQKWDNLTPYRKKRIKKALMDMKEIFYDESYFFSKDNGKFKVYH
jgi:hypothetical protein